MRKVSAGRQPVAVSTRVGPKIPCESVALAALTGVAEKRVMSCMIMEGVLSWVWLR